MRQYGDNLDWSVDSYSVTINTEPPRVDKNLIGLARSDTNTILGYVSPNYEVVQNAKLFELVKPLIDSDVAFISNKGFLQQGKKVFVQLNLYEQYNVMGYNYTPFITILNSHNGSSKLGIGTGNIRVVCTNTFQAASGELNHHLTHTVGINQQLDISSVLDYIKIVNKNHNDQIITLDKIIIQPGKMTDIIHHVFGENDKIYNNIVRLYRTGAGNNGKTANDLFNATTDYISNVQKSNPTSAKINPIIGGGAAKSLKMLDTLLQLA